MFDRLWGSKLFAKLRLETRFHQMRLCPSDIEKTAFKTKDVHLKFSVVPMGLRNASGTFYALMSYIFRNCIDQFLVVYLDNMSIFSADRENHLRHLRLALFRSGDSRLYPGSNTLEVMSTDTEISGPTIGRTKINIGEDGKKLIRAGQKPPICDGA